TTTSSSGSTPQAPTQTWPHRCIKPPDSSTKATPSASADHGPVRPHSPGHNSRRPCPKTRSCEPAPAPAGANAMTEHSAGPASDAVSEPVAIASDEDLIDLARHEDAHHWATHQRP